MTPAVIKVCGVRTPEVAEAALAAGATHLGLVLAPSPREVSLDQATDLVRSIPGRWVGVFVDADEDVVVRVSERLDLAAVQLHGNEASEMCDRLHATLGREVWKAVPWSERHALETYVDIVDAILIDYGPGGSGERLPWGEVGASLADRSFRLILAGGLDARNVGQAIERSGADGVDASSRLESSPGVKDLEAVRAFARTAADTMASRA